jgi:hypothetical protein
MTVRLDSTPPTVSLVLPPTTSGWYNTQPVISPTTSDSTSGVASIEYSVDGGPFQSSLTSMSDGAHSFTIRVTDKAGNFVISPPYNAQVDMTPPVSAFISPPEGSTAVAVGNFTMIGTTSDATSGVAGAQISLDGETTWSPLTVNGGNWSYLWDTGKVTNGTYQVYVRGVDVAGNIEHTAHVTVTVANQGPGVSITKYWVIGQAATIKITTHVLPIAGGRITISHQNSYDVQTFDYTSVPTKFKWNGITSKGTSAPPGLYTVRVEIWDGYGHHASDSGVLWIPAPLPAATPTPTITHTPTATTTELPIAQPTRTATSLASVLSTPVPSTPMPVAVATQKPVPTPVTKSLAVAWPAAFTGSLVVLFLSVSLLDPRPAAWCRLARIRSKSNLKS